MPEIQIRPAVPTDIATLIDIEHDYKSNYVWQMDLGVDEGQVDIHFREVRLPRQVRVDYPRPVQSLRENWSARSAILVGVLEGESVGYICLDERLAPSTVWVTDLAVAVGHRRKGIASGLVLAAQDWGRERNHRRIILEIQSKNLAAIRMAQRLGFEFCGYNDHYYANQDIAIFFAQFLR